MKYLAKIAERENFLIKMKLTYLSKNKIDKLKLKDTCFS